MSKIDDAQISKTVYAGQTAHFSIDTPSGKIPSPASDSPVVSPQVGTTTTAKTVVTVFQRIATIS